MKLPDLSAAEVEALLGFHRACREGRSWATGKALRDAWATCVRGDWMLWLLGQKADDPEWPTRQQAVLAACAVAELALPVFEANNPDDCRPRHALETARAWAHGDATVEQVDAASAAAHKASQEHWTGYPGACAAMYAADTYYESSYDMAAHYAAVAGVSSEQIADTIRAVIEQEVAQ